MEYLQYGGFPAIIDEDTLQKRKMLTEYYDTIYYKDILERYNVRDKSLIKGFMKYLLHTYSSLLSPAKLAEYLKNEGKKGSKTTLTRYVSYFKEAFFLLECNKFGYSPKAQFISPKKFYLIDQGFVKL
jgi:predicted AAA+ superfamily ATPase